MPVFQTFSKIFTSLTTTPEADVFNDNSNKWWDLSGPFAALHHMNPIRVDYILRKLGREDLKGLRILDVGCGGGILCEALAHCGAEVVGVDQNQSAIDAAHTHAQEHDLNIIYTRINLNELKEKKFDIVCALEVLEHTDPKPLIEDCFKHLKKNGSFFFSTINRTAKSYLGAIIAAEYVLRLAPRGTHKWEDFLKPSEIWQAVSDVGGSEFHVEGLCYNPVTKVWRRSNDLDINYIGSAKKI